MDSTSPIFSDVMRVMNASNGESPFHFYDAIIHTDEYDMKVMLIINIEFDNDFANNVGEYIFIDMVMPMGDVVKHIYPKRNNLEITINKNINENIITKRYKFVALNIDENMASNRYQSKSLEDLNKEELMGLSGQCLDRGLEIIRTLNFTGIYRDVTPETLLKLAFTTNLSNIRAGGETITQTLDIVEPDNDRIYDHLIIPNGTKLVDLPSYLQEAAVGVYNASLGLYIKKYNDINTTSIYPLYNTNVVRNNLPVLIVYSIPSIQFSYIENTYLLEAGDLYIITSEDKKHIDLGDTAYMNDGVGYVAVKSTRILNNPVLTENGTSYNNVNELVTSKHSKTRKDGIIYSKYGEITDNLYNQRSQNVAQSGTILQLRWSSSNDTYLRPGMKVKYTFIRDNKVVIIDGVLHGYYSLFNNTAKKTNTLLNIFLSKDDYVED